MFFGRFLYTKKQSSCISKKQEAVSVVICARNEATNLRKNLPKVLMQSYPKFEVLVIDDASNDDTASILQAFQAQYSFLRVIRINEKKQAGKKAALSLALANAQHNWLLLTDADGVPASKHWIEGMMRARVSEQTQIVLGYGPYYKYPEWINKWIRYETHYVAMQYYAAASWGIPYMGVGRNLLYHKDLYWKYAEVFKTHSDLASGDDDLFINVAAKSCNTVFCTDCNAFVYSEPKRTFKELYRQKTRHYSTSTRYKWKHQILLAGLNFSHLGFWFLVGLASVHTSVIFILLIVLLRFFIILLIWQKTLRIFKDGGLFLFIIILDMISPIYYLIFAPSLFFKQSSHWK